MIQAIICDFDGTLANTFAANYHAYKDAFSEQGLTLTEDDYRAAFGLRFDGFMRMAGIEDIEVARRIRERKRELYPQYFHLLKPNTRLLEMVRAFHHGGGKTAIASTARRENLEAALKNMGATDIFDVILCGEMVEHGKPHPEIYLKALDMLQVKADEALCFEDSQTGMQAAQAGGVQCIRVTNDWYIE